MLLLQQVDHRLGLSADVARILDDPHRKTGCEHDGLSLLQNYNIRLCVSSWYRKNIALVFGLFCSENFSNEGNVKPGEIIGEDPSKIEHINIKAKVVIRLENRV